jgi:ERCC4-type nuclease
MSIVVTPTETALIEALRQAGVEPILEPLLVGDAHIRDTAGDLKYIFERKAKGDLDASIKDHRYSEQKTRLFETGLPRKSIVYIIEQLSIPKDPTTHKRIWSAMCNTQHRDKCTVFQTRSISETAAYLIAMASSVNKFPTDLDSTDQTTSGITVNIKKRQVTKEDWFKYSLTLIPRCSPTIADTIVSKYASLSSLYSEIKNNDDQCLANLTYGANNRKIGKKLSSDICEIILNNF